MKIKIKYFKTFNLLGILVLTACSNYSNDFDCVDIVFRKSVPLNDTRTSYKEIGGIEQAPIPGEQ